MVENYQKLGEKFKLVLWGSNLFENCEKKCWKMDLKPESNDQKVKKMKLNIE